MSNRIIIVLLGLLVGLEAAGLYRQEQSGTRGQPVPSSRTSRSPVQDAPKGTSMDLTGLPIAGDKNAKVVLIEFSDFECPFCARHASGVGAELHRKFVAPGKIRHAFANNPLPIHQNARFLAIAAICAGEQGKYWEMHDAVFKAKIRSKEAIGGLMESLNIDKKTFDRCVEDGAGTASRRIASDTAKAQEFKLSGTPAFAVGRLDSGGKVLIEKFIFGAQPLPVFENAINEVLLRA